MLKKICPWCGEKTTLNQLGRRPVKKKPQWYEFSRSVRVCPYCAGAVKPGGKSMWFVVLALPAFMSFMIDSFTGFNVLKELDAETAGWVLFLLGCIGAYYFGIFEKVENV